MKTVNIARVHGGWYKRFAYFPVQYFDGKNCGWIWWEYYEHQWFQAWWGHNLYFRRPIWNLGYPSVNE